MKEVDDLRLPKDILCDKVFKSRTSLPRSRVTYSTQQRLEADHSSSGAGGAVSPEYVPIG